MSYARNVFTDGGWPTLLLTVIPVLSLLVTKARERRCAAIFAATGWLLVIGAVATAN